MYRICGLSSTCSKGDWGFSASTVSTESYCFNHDVSGTFQCIHMLLTANYRGPTLSLLGRQVSHLPESNRGHRSGGLTMLGNFAVLESQKVPRGFPPLRLAEHQRSPFYGLSV